MQPSFTSAAERPFSHPLPGSRRRRAPASKKLFHYGEIPAEFFALLEKGFARYQPSNINDGHAVADCVRAAWFYLRHSRARNTFETKLRRHKPDAANWVLAESDKLDALTHYHHQARRALLHALKKIRHLRHAPLADPVSHRQLLSLFMSIFDFELVGVKW